MKSHQLTSSRRDFLKKSTLAALSSGIPSFYIGRSWGQKKPANSRIQIGVIGYGKRTRGLMNSAMSQSDTQIVSICDVVKERLDHGITQSHKKYSSLSNKPYTGTKGYADFREMFANEKLDAVIIGTPDHGHVVQCLLAARKNLDIYCEKPLTLNIHEGRVLSDVVKKKKIVFQTGSQQRSEFGHRFKRAAELVSNGYLGEIKEVFVNVGAPPVPCDLPGEPIPEGTEWDLWVGPVAYRDYNSILCPKGIHNHFPAFRKYSEFAGGALADIGAHHFDIVQWALGMDDTGPVAINPTTDGSNRNLEFIYKNGIKLTHGGSGSITFIGSEGTLRVGRGQISADPKSILDIKLKSSDTPVYHSTNHMRNWIDCIHSRKDPICTAEIGHRSASICHLANLGYLLKRPLNWDPKNEKFIKDDDANTHLSRPIRAPWNLEELDV